MEKRRDEIVLAIARRILVFVAVGFLVGFGMGGLGHTHAQSRDILRLRFQIVALKACQEAAEKQLATVTGECDYRKLRSDYGQDQQYAEE